MPKFKHDEEVDVNLQVRARVAAHNYDGTYELAYDGDKTLDWIPEDALSSAPLTPRVGDTWQTSDGSLWQVFKVAGAKHEYRIREVNGAEYYHSGPDLRNFMLRNPVLLFRPGS